MSGITSTARCAAHSQHAHDTQTLPKKSVSRSESYAAPEKGQTRKAGKRARLGMARGLNGVVVLPAVLNGRQITSPVMDAALSALRQLPKEDLALIARKGIRISLLPVSSLEDGLLGATTIKQASDGSWRPTEIRVAAAAGLPGGQAVGEIVQHEVGHALAVLRKQDKSEEAAIGYANKH